MSNAVTRFYPDTGELQKKNSEVNIPNRGAYCLVKISSEIKMTIGGLQSKLHQQWMLCSDAMLDIASAILH